MAQEDFARAHVGALHVRNDSFAGLTNQRSLPFADSLTPCAVRRFIWIGFLPFNTSSGITCILYRHQCSWDNVDVLLGRCCINVVVASCTTFMTYYFMTWVTNRRAQVKTMVATLAGGVSICAGRALARLCVCN